MSCAWPNSCAHQGHAAAGLAARPLELVLELGVLEILEIERGGMLHQATLEALVTRSDSRLSISDDDAAQHVGQDGERELGEQQQRPAS